MKEIHKIQEELYEEQKKLTEKEKLAALHREAEEAEKKYGLALKKVSRCGPIAHPESRDKDTTIRDPDGKLL